MTALSTPQRARRAGLALLLAAAAHWAMATSPALLPPGLYQIDSEGTWTHEGELATFYGHSDGATGDSVSGVQMNVGPGTAHTTKHKGNGPITHCISRTGPLYVPSAGPALCTKNEMRQVGDAVVITALCPAGRVKLTMRRLDEARWEQVGEEVVGGPDVPPNLMGLKSLLQMAARTARTPEERAAASKHLSELPALQQQMVAKRQESIDQLSSAMRKSTDVEERESLRKAIDGLRGTIQVRSRSRQVWTRIGSCTPAKQIK